MSRMPPREESSERCGVSQDADVPDDVRRRSGASRRDVAEDEEEKKGFDDPELDLAYTQTSCIMRR